METIEYVVKVDLDCDYYCFADVFDDEDAAIKCYDKFYRRYAGRDGNGEFATIELIKVTNVDGEAVDFDIVDSDTLCPTYED